MTDLSDHPSEDRSGLPKATFTNRHWPVMLCLTVLALGFVHLKATPAPRVGDGSEYYALFIAWRDTLRPFMTPASWAGYAAFFEAHQVPYLVAPDALKAAFPALVSGNTADFNHFWFYGLIPALVARLLAPLVKVHPQTMFLAFHYFLAALPIALSWKYFRWRGLWATVILFLLSPAVWYADKVHTEFFTVSLVLCSVIFFRAGRLLPSALCLALASTQNISLLAVALIVVLMDVVRRHGRLPYSTGDAVTLIATAFAVAIHPLYYFFRLGALTPQLVAGGAEIGANLKTFYLWFLDPDLGLLPNWPLIVFLFVLTRIRTVLLKPEAVLTELEERRPSAPGWLVYVGSYLLINLFAQSSTQNLNSGATPGLARYALWYVPLFFPICLGVGAMLEDAFARRPSGAASLDQAVYRDRTRRRLVGATLICGLAGGCVYSYVYFRPALTEAGAYEPSWSSALLQRYAPGLYDPPPEVFMERYGMIGESVELNHARAIVGPDCRKLLLLRRDNPLVFGGPTCMYSSQKLVQVLNQSGRPGFNIDSRYVRLTDEEAARARYSVESNAWEPVDPTGLNQAVLAAGWGTSEAWGVWSSAKVPELRFPCTEGATPVRIDLSLRAFLTAGHEAIRTRFMVAGKLVEEQTFKLPDVAERVVSLAVPSGSCQDGRVKVAIDIIEPMTPLALGLSDDARLLGVGLSRFRLEGKQ